MAVTFFFASKRPSLTGGAGDTFTFDASFSETHSVRARYTKEPIEGGARLSDHRILEQRPLSMQVVVSSAALGGILRDRHVQAWGRMVAYVQADPPQLFTVSTGLETLKNVVLVSASAPRTPETGNALIADLELVQLTFSSTDIAANLADAAQDLALGEVDLGSQGLG